jgi:iron complex outermembrane receptor protein
MKRDRKQKRDNAIERACEALLPKGAVERTSTSSRVLWAVCAGLSSLALGLYHPAMAQDQPGRDRQPAPREPERGFGLWNILPPIRPETDPPADPFWPKDRDRNARGTSRLMAQQGFGEPPKQHFEIPAGQLGPALTVFSRQTGLQLLYLSELVEGRTTAGVQGDYTPEDGLRALLSGTGLEHQFSDAKTVILQPASALGAAGAAGATAAAAQAEETKPVKVPEIVVKEKKERALVVDQPDGYKADVSSEAVLRFPARIQELPMSVSVVTKDSMRDRRAVTQTQALEGIAGVGKAGSTALAADDYFIRGFATDQRTPGYTRDNGLSAFNSYFADPILYDRIEVIKGPASFTSGLVGAGGFVNRLLKAPVNSNFVHAEAGGGSYGHYRTTLDANGVMPNLPLAGRLVFSYNDDAEFFRNTGNRRYSFLPSIRFATDNDFVLTVTGNVQRLRGKGYLGTATTTTGTIPADIFESFAASQNTFESDYHSIHADAEKRFAQGLRLKAKGQYSRSDTNYRYGLSFEPGGIGPNGNFDVYGFGRDLTRDSFAGEINLTKDFSLFGNLSSVAVGMDLSNANQRSLSTDFLLLGTGNIANPIINFPFPPALLAPAPFLDQDLTIRQTGAFAQGLFRPLADTTVMVGLRGNWIAQHGEANFASQSEIGLNHSRFTPQIGLSQRVVEGLNIYASYGESIQANFAITSNGSLLKPMTGKSFEVGSKWEPLGQRLRLTAALFRTNLDEVATPDPTNLLFSIGGQSQRNQGFEFEAQGAPWSNLHLSLAYTYLDTEITKSQTPNAIGARAANIPKHTVSAFASYDLSELVTNGLKLGAVVYYRTDVAGTPGVNQAEIFAGYTRADLFAVYAPLKWLSLQVNVNNIADARYVEAPFIYGGFNQFGAPRHVIGMVRMTF